MKTKLYQGVDSKDKQAIAERKEVILSGSNAFKVLTSVIEKEIQDIQSTRDKVSFESPNFAFSQAEAAGTIKAYRKVQSLLKLKD